jgi:hypothetical protein
MSVEQISELLKGAASIAERKYGKADDVPEDDDMPEDVADDEQELLFNILGKPCPIMPFRQS